jgi:hypothetical protein
MDEDKVAAVTSWAQPATTCALRGFLGLAEYYCRFIKNFGMLAAPAEGFGIRRAQGGIVYCAGAPPPRFHQALHGGLGASSTGFGAVLHQGAGPLAFYSKLFATRHLKVAAYERELIGLVQAVHHWRPYLWGRNFIVRTDHYALKYILDQRLSTVPQHQWISKVLGLISPSNADWVG